MTIEENTNKIKMNGIVPISVYAFMTIHFGIIFLPYISSYALRWYLCFFAVEAILASCFLCKPKQCFKCIPKRGCKGARINMRYIIHFFQIGNLPRENFKTAFNSSDLEKEKRVTRNTQMWIRESLQNGRQGKK